MHSISHTQGGRGLEVSFFFYFFKKNRNLGLMFLNFLVTFTAGVEWNELEPLQEDYCMTRENTATPSHPSNVDEVSSAPKSTGG